MPAPLTKIQFEMIFSSFKGIQPDAYRWDEVMKRNKWEPERLFVSISDVCRMASVSRTTIYNWRAQGLFPAPVQLGPKRIAWRHTDVQRWAETRQAA